MSGRWSLACTSGRLPAHRTRGVANERANGSPRWMHRSSRFAQQMRSNLTLQAHTNHHPPALLVWCNALLREGSWWAPWWGSLDGMQEVRGSSPLSSTPINPQLRRPCLEVNQPAMLSARGWGMVGGQHPQAASDSRRWRHPHGWRLLFRHGGEALRGLGPPMVRCPVAVWGRLAQLIQPPCIRGPEEYLQPPIGV
jgi:hypothetical protein